MSTGEAFPALFADAGEGVSSSHTGPPVGTWTGGTCAVFGCGKRKGGSKDQTVNRKSKSLTPPQVFCSSKEKADQSELLPLHQQV